MSTTIMSPALSLLQSMNSSSSSTDLISILYGGGTSGSGSSDPVAALTQAEANQTQDIKLQENDPQTKNETNHFLSVVAKAKTLQDVLNDPIARKVLLTANGLGDQVDYTALATKALLSDPSQSNNFASTLSNTAWLSAAKTYNFATNGLSVLKQPSVLSTITSGYAQVQWEQSLDQTTPGLSAALDFRARASTITSVDQILGDATFRQVVTTTLGIPEQIAFQPLQAQEQAIATRLDVSKFKDPAYVEQFARQFLIENSLNNSSSSSSSSSAITSLLA